MSGSDDALLAERLIAAPSVTPAAGLVFDVLEAMLVPLGFAVTRFHAGGPPDGPVENLLAARLGPKGSRHFAFAGHLDVVPPGDGWTSAPFAPERRGELLYGRGAVDMKGSIAAMVAAAAELPVDAGTVSLIITGDEEGAAKYGTLALIDHMRAAGEAPDVCLVGEPTSVNRLGDMMKIGRRGSVNIWLEVAGQEGHVAYPHLADNPAPRLVALLAELDALALDEGTEWFQASNLEITQIRIDNPATNVIPATASARPGHRPRSLDHGRHVRRAVPQGLVPGDRVRPVQRHDAQARRGRGGGRSGEPRQNLSPDRGKRAQGLRLHACFDKLSMSGGGDILPAPLSLSSSKAAHHVCPSPATLLASQFKGLAEGIQWRGD
jgi:succinyl-diaminopimelate desuccinylase